MRTAFSLFERDILAAVFCIPFKDTVRDFNLSMQTETGQMNGQTYESDATSQKVGGGGGVGDLTANI